MNLLPVHRGGKGTAAPSSGRASCWRSPGPPTTPNAGAVRPANASTPSSPSTSAGPARPPKAPTEPRAIHAELAEAATASRKRAHA